MKMRRCKVLIQLINLFKLFIKIITIIILWKTILIIKAQKKKLQLKHPKIRDFYRNNIIQIN